MSGGGGGDRCLICHKKDGWGLKIENVRGFLEGTGGSVLDRHLEVFWLLGKVLEVPGEQLAMFLESCPDNLEDWIKICGQCGGLVKDCQVVYQRLLEVNRRWMECRLRVQGIIKETWEDEGDLEEMEVDIARECRDFVKKNEYKSWRNPFPGGDLRALELANKMVVKQEVEEEFGPSSEEEYWTFSPAGGSADDNNLREDNQKEDYKPEVKKSTKPKRGNKLPPSRLPVTCHLCNKTLATQHSLTGHLDVIHHIKTSKPSSYPFCTYAKKSPKEQQEALLLPGNIFRVLCPVSHCPQTWSSLPPYLAHMEKEHTSKEKSGVTCLSKVIECMECGKMFRNPEQAEVHLLKHDKTLKRDKICEFCGAGFVTKERLLAHKHIKAECRQKQGLQSIVSELDKKPVNCHLCSKQLSNARNLKLHLFMLHNIGRGGNHECPKCQKTFPNNLLLNRHTRSLCGTLNTPKVPKCPVPASKIPAECPICKKPIRSSLKRHLYRVHHNELNFECPKCQKRFPTNLLLDKHTQSLCGSLKIGNSVPKPLPEKKFRLKCPVPHCPQTWSNPNTDLLSYRSHLATQHTEEEKAELSKLPKFLECLECKKSFYCYEYGRIHLYKHDKSLKKPIVCDTCGACFLCRANLKVHKERSLQCGKQKGLTESKIICDICGNGYANKNSLQAHIREKHKENKPVVCDICGKCYSSRSSLQKHVRERHERIFKDICEHCGKALESKYKLKIHLAAVHKIGNFKGKEHKCPEEGCGKVFYSKGQLTNHLYGVHKQGEPGFKCEQCGKAFYAPGYLSQHINVVHKGYRWKPKSKKEEVAAASSE